MKKLALLLSAIFLTASIAQAQTTVDSLYSSESLAIGLAQATGATEIGSLGGLIRALDQMSPEQRTVYLNKTKGNIATIQIAIAK